MSFQIHSLPVDEFAPLFGAGDAVLARANARRVHAGEHPGYPCRVSLREAEIGESLILVNFEHQPALTPYRSNHAIYVREYAEQAFPAPGEIPAPLAARLISVRGFDREHDLVYANVVEGGRLGDELPRLFRRTRIEYIHLHNAGAGCYAARVTRA